MRNRLPSLGAPLAALRQCKPERGDILGSPPGAPRTATIIVSLSIAAIVALSLWYLVQSQPLLLQEEVDATRVDIAARVDGRVVERPVDRGDHVARGQVAVTIDNPELLTRLKEARPSPATPAPA